MAEFYSNGTAAATNGDVTIVAEGAAVWIPANVKSGDAIFIDGLWNVVETEPVFDVGLDTYTLDMGVPFSGSTDTGLSYIIVKTSSEWGTNRTLSLQTAELIQAFSVGLITESQLNDAVAAAEAAQAAGEAAFDQIDALYLGAKSSDPTSDNGGHALVAGQIYFNSVSGLLRLYSGSTWSNMLAGVQGIQGVGAGVPMTFMTSTSDADPSSGNFRLNNTTHSSATKAWVDNADANAADISTLLDSWDDSANTNKGLLLIRSKINAAVFRYFKITGSVVDKTGYRELTLVYVTGAGTLSNSTACELVFTPYGDVGSTGAPGQTAGVALTFSTTTTDSDPGTGVIRANNATFLSITSLFIDNADAGAVSIVTWLDSLDDVTNANMRGYLRLQKPTDPTVFMELAVTGPVTDGGGYRKVPVAPISGAIPADATSLVAVFAPSGADGAAGADGGDPGVLLNFDTSTTDSNPSAGGIRANNATLTSATTLYVSKTNRAGNSIATFLATLDDSSNPTVKGTVVLSRPSDGAQIVYSMTALTDATGYVKVTVASGSGVAGFSNNDPVSFQFARAGDQGTSGAGTGDFNGPASGVDGNLVAFDGGTGKLGKDSGKAIADLVLAANNGSDFSNRQTAFDNLSLKGASVASASTVNLETATGSLVHITGTTTTTAITLADGHYRRIIADAAWPITAGANLVLNNSGSSYTCAAGDQLDVYADGTTIRVAVVPVSGTTPGALPASYLDTDSTLTANSNSKVPSQAAIKTYVDGIIAAQDAMVFKGVINCSTNPNYPAADRGWTYRVSVAGKIGGASGTNVEVGDILICLTDSTSSGTQAGVGSAWSVIQTNIDGALTTASIGSSVQAYDADLSIIAGLTPTSDNFMQAKAGAWASRTPAQVAADIPIYNCGLAFSVSSSALTIALKQMDGSSDPSSTGPVSVAMRSATASSSARTLRSATAAQSLVIPSTATMGRTSAIVGHLYHYLIDNAGTLELAVSGKYFGKSGIVSTTTVGTGSDSYDVMYSTTGRSSVPFICIGRSIDTQTTAGTWAAVPTTVDIDPEGQFPANFRASKSGGNQSITSATYTKAGMGTEVFDNGGFYDATNSRWRPPAGLVQITAGCGMAGVNDGAYAIAALYKNGVILQQAFQRPGSAAADIGSGLTLFDVANGADYYELYAYIVGTSPTIDSGTGTFFSGSVVPGV